MNRFIQFNTNFSTLDMQVPFTTLWMSPWGEHWELLKLNRSLPALLHRPTKRRMRLTSIRLDDFLNQTSVEYP